MTAAVTAAAMLALAGCKSGSNLVKLPKMPTNLVTWGKDKPSDVDVANKEASKLPPPSMSQLAGQSDSNASPYPNTGYAAHQPAGSAVPGRSSSDPSAMAGLGSRSNDAGGQRDPYSPAYAQGAPGGSYGQSGGFYDGSAYGYDRTASRENPYAPAAGDRYREPSYSAPAPSAGAPYRDSGFRGGAAAGVSYGGDNANSARDNSRYSQMADYESVGNQPNPIAKAGSLTDPGLRYSPAGSGNAAPPSRDSGTCTGDSCSVPNYSGSQPSSSREDPHYRPFGTGDYQPGRWAPPSRPATAEGVEPASYGPADASSGTAELPRQEDLRAAGYGSAAQAGPYPPRDSGFYQGGY